MPKFLTSGVGNLEQFRTMRCLSKDTKNPSAQATHGILSDNNSHAKSLTCPIFLRNFFAR